MAKDDNKDPASKLGEANNSSISAQASSDQKQPITICGLDGTQFELKLPETATVLDLKVEIEEKKGTPRYLQDIYKSSRELGNDEKISEVVHNNETLYYYQNTPLPLHDALDLMRDAYDDDAMNAQAQEMLKTTGIYFDKDTGQRGATCISNFWSFATPPPRFTWNGPADCDPDFEIKKIFNIKETFSALDKKLTKELEQAIGAMDQGKVQIALNNGANINSRFGVFNETPLHTWATADMWQNQEMVIFLLNHGADVFARTQRDSYSCGNDTVLECGNHTFRYLILQYLAKNRADIDSSGNLSWRDSDDNLSRVTTDSVQVAAIAVILSFVNKASLSEKWRDKNEEKWKPWKEAAKEFLTEHVNFVHVRNEGNRDDYHQYLGQSALLHVADWNFPGAVKVLLDLDHRADPKATAESGVTALYLAAKAGTDKNGSAEDVRLLLEHGADLWVDLDREYVGGNGHSESILHPVWKLDNAVKNEILSHIAEKVTPENLENLLLAVKGGWLSSQRKDLQSAIKAAQSALPKGKKITEAQIDKIKEQIGEINSAYYKYEEYCYENKKGSRETRLSNIKNAYKAFHQEIKAKPSNTAGQATQKRPPDKLNRSSGAGAGASRSASPSGSPSPRS